MQISLPFIPWDLTHPHRFNLPVNNTTPGTDLEFTEPRTNRGQQRTQPQTIINGFNRWRALYRLYQIVTHKYHSSWHDVTAEKGNLNAERSLKYKGMQSRQNELLGTLSDYIIHEKVTTGRWTPIIGRNPQVILFVILNFESRRSFQRHVDNARVYSAAQTCRRVHKSRSRQPVRRVRERTDKMERTILMVCCSFRQDSSEIINCVVLE